MFITGIVVFYVFSMFYNHTVVTLNKKIWKIAILAIVDEIFENNEDGTEKMVWNLSSQG